MSGVQQRIVIILTRQQDGNLAIGVQFHPKLANKVEKFNELPEYRKKMQNAAADIARYVMKAMVKQNEGNNGTVDASTG